MSILKNVGFVAAGLIGATAIPSIASTATETITLTPGQIEFIRQFDYASKTNFSGLVQNPAAIPMIKSASAACGNLELQKQTVYAAGGNKADADYASNKFETLFCNNNI
jgi:hydroxymethylglutaryl-CoA reductase